MRPPKRTLVDFSPWTGRHAEDAWGPAGIQDGYADKNPIKVMGYATPRLDLIDALNLRNKVRRLSRAVAGVSLKRAQRGRVANPSTFKPPPRVTLTDTKRDIWLRDLARPRMSLRRLSRTIPHGVRAKTLLDHCLNKNIPVTRALWLAWCVGANELRSFRRKIPGGGGSGSSSNSTSTAAALATPTAATAGPLTYLHDWTASVEQFVDGVIAEATSQVACDNWQARIMYA